MDRNYFGHRLRVRGPAGGDDGGCLHMDARLIGELRKGHDRTDKVNRGARGAACTSLTRSRPRTADFHVENMNDPHSAHDGVPR